MASDDLSRRVEINIENPGSYRIGMVVSEWNEEITSALATACKDKLMQHGLSEDQIPTVHVPGTFELPAAAKMLMREGNLDAVVCIGCVIKGETAHNEYISHSVALGLQQLGVMSGVPCIFGVLTPNTQQQALDRAGGKYGNKGDEAAYTALKMAKLKKDHRQGQKKIGFS